MKRFLLSATIATLALAAFEAAATPVPPIHGPITLNWTISEQKLDSVAQFPGKGKTTITGAANNKTTNVTQVYKDTSASSAFNNTTLLDLLSNSLGISFPAGTHLLFDGTELLIVDSTGENQIVSNSVVASVLTVSSTNQTKTGSETIVTKTSKSPTITVSTHAGSSSEIILINYDDSAKPPTDGATVFTFVGKSTSQSSSIDTETDDTIKATGAETFNVSGVGYGMIRGTAVNISGTISGSVSGTETISLPVP
jgi:hypothetical protein